MFEGEVLEGDAFIDVDSICFLMSVFLSRTVSVMGAEMFRGCETSGVKLVAGMVKVPLFGELNR